MADMLYTDHHIEFHLNLMNIYDSDEKVNLWTYEN
jgi:hypothetical protein